MPPPPLTVRSVDGSSLASEAEDAGPATGTPGALGSAKEPTPRGGGRVQFRSKSLLRGAGNAGFLDSDSDGDGDADLDIHKLFHAAAQSRPAVRLMQRVDQNFVPSPERGEAALPAMVSAHSPPTTAAAAAATNNSDDIDGDDGASVGGWQIGSQPPHAPRTSHHGMRAGRTKSLGKNGQPGFVTSTSLNNSRRDQPLPSPSPAGGAVTRRRNSLPPVEAHAAGPAAQHAGKHAAIATFPAPRPEPKTKPPPKPQPQRQAAHVTTFPSPRPEPERPRFTKPPAAKKRPSSDDSGSEEEEEAEETEDEEEEGEEEEEEDRDDEEEEEKEESGDLQELGKAPFAPAVLEAPHTPTPLHMQVPVPARVYEDIMPEWEVSNYWTRIRNLKRWYWAFDRIIDFRRKYLLILITNRNVNLGVLIRMAAKDETATTFVDKEEKLKDLKYIAQGNNDYYSEENMFKRFVLMKSKAIRRAVDLWWNVAYQPKIETVPKKQILHKWQYVDMNIRMQLALVPDLPGAEALECAEEDWKDDAHGKHSMGRESFFHALFQLADLWVDSVHEQDYVRFLLNLLISVAKSPPWPPTTWLDKGEIKVVGTDELLGDDRIQANIAAADVIAERLEHAEHKRLQVTERLVAMARKRKEADETKKYIERVRTASKNLSAALHWQKEGKGGPGPSAVFADTRGRFDSNGVPVPAGPSLLLSQEAQGIAEEIRKAKSRSGSTFGLGDRWQDSNDGGGGAPGDEHKFTALKYMERQAFMQYLKKKRLTLRTRLFNSAVRQVTPPPSVVESAKIKTEVSDWLGMVRCRGHGSDTDNRGQRAFVVGTARRPMADHESDYDLGGYDSPFRGLMGRGGIFRSRSTGRLRSKSMAGSDVSDTETDARSVGRRRGKSRGARKSRGGGKRRRKRAKSQPALPPRQKSMHGMQMLPNRIHGTIFVSQASGPVLGGESVRKHRLANAKADDDAMYAAVAEHLDYGGGGTSGKVDEREIGGIGVGPRGADAGASHALRHHHGMKYEHPPGYTHGAPGAGAGAGAERHGYEHATDPDTHDTHAATGGSGRPPPLSGLALRRRLALIARGMDPDSGRFKLAHHMPAMARHAHRGPPELPEWQRRAPVPRCGAAPDTEFAGDPFPVAAADSPEWMPAHLRKFRAAWGHRGGYAEPSLDKIMDAENPHGPEAMRRRMHRPKRHHAPSAWDAPTPEHLFGGLGMSPTLRNPQHGAAVMIAASPRALREALPGISQSPRRHGGGFAGSPGVPSPSEGSPGLPQINKRQAALLMRNAQLHSNNKHVDRWIGRHTETYWHKEHRTRWDGGNGMSGGNGMFG